MILAAGQGTRLLPLTCYKPKPLFPIRNQPLLEITLAYLRRFSFSRVILNTHHLAPQIEAFVKDRQPPWPFEITTRYEPEILGTGGGIGQTRDFWQESPFLIINGDIVTDIDLNEALDFHRNHGGPATLVLHDYPEFNQIAVDPFGRIQTFRQEKGEGLAFTGIHILDRKIFDYLPSSGAYDSIPVYQQMIREGIPIYAYISKGHYWRDIGTPKSYLQIHQEFPGDDPSFEGKIFIHPEAQIEKGVVFSGWASIGKGCRLQKGCHLSNSVLWESVVVPSGISVSDSVIGSGVYLIRNAEGAVIV